MSRHLILGGARSGKSALASRLAGETRLPVCYLATAQALDDEMSARITRHRSDRAADWVTVEEPVRLGEALAREAHTGRCLVIDCLTLWLSNCLLADCANQANVALSPLPLWERESARLLVELARASGEILLVSNEVGCDVVPPHALARRFRDEQGRLNQAVAQACERVTLVMAGLSVPLKPSPR